MDKAILRAGICGVWCVSALRQTWHPGARFSYLQTSRPDCGLMLMLSGGATFTDGAGACTAAVPGDILWLPRGSHYEFRADEHVPDTKSLLVNFNLQSDTVPGNIETIARGVSGEGTRAAHFRRLCDLFAARMDAGLPTTGELCVLLDLLLRADEPVPGMPERLMPAVRRMRAEVGKPAPVASLARLCGMNECYFRRLFRRAAGTSPAAYMNTLRIEKARQLLLTDGMTQEAVAEALGYCDAAYFGNAFRRATGMTPAVYRKSGSAAQNRAALPEEDIDTRLS